MLAPKDTPPSIGEEILDLRRHLGVSNIVLAIVELGLLGWTVKEFNRDSPGNEISGTFIMCCVVVLVHLVVALWIILMIADAFNRQGEDEGLKIKVMFWPRGNYGFTFWGDVFIVGGLSLGILLSCCLVPILQFEGFEIAAIVFAPCVGLGLICRIIYMFISWFTVNELHHL